MHWRTGGKERDAKRFIHCGERRNWRLNGGEEKADMGKVLPRLQSIVMSESIILLQLRSVPVSVA